MVLLSLQMNPVVFVLWMSSYQFGPIEFTAFCFVKQIKPNNFLFWQIKFQSPIDKVQFQYKLVIIYLFER